MGLTRVRAEQILDIDYKQAVRVIATSNVSNLAATAPSVVDGIAVSLNDRVLVNGQTTASQNGIYYVAVVGTGATGTWTRSNDANATGEVNAGMIVMVTEGALYADTLWKLITNNPIVIDVTALEYVLNSTSSFDVINANGTPVSANTVSNTINYVSGNNLVITGSDMTDTVNFSVADAPNFSGNITTLGNVFVARDISVTGNLTIGANLNVVNVNQYVGATGNISFLGNLLPGSSNALNYSLGLPGQPWSNIYVDNLNVAEFVGTDLSITGTQTSNILIVNNDATVNGNLTVLGTTTTINSNIIVTNDKNIELANNISELINLDGAGLLAGNAANTHVTNWTYNYAANAWSTNVGVSVVGNVTGNYFIGNGSQLTGLPEQYSNANVITLLSAYGNNISSTGNITAANFRVNAGGAIGVAPQQEIHVASNGSDADGNGSITNPFRTITHALTVTGSGSVMIVHPGSYTEDVAINNISAVAITAAAPGAASPQSYVITGNVTVSGTSTSILLHSIGVVGSINHSSSGSFFVTAIQLGTGANSTTFAKTGTGYLEVTDGNWQGGTPAVSVTGAGPVTFNGVQLTNLTVNNANASVLLRNVPTAINTTLTSGTLTVLTSTMYGNSNTAPAITTVAGTLNIQNSLLLRANNTAGTMTVGAATAYLYDDIFFDRTNSTLSGVPISGTAFAPPAEFQAVRADSLSVTANVVGGNIRTVGQITATGNITGGNITTTGNLNVTGFTKTQTTTYSSLISATTAGTGAKAFITDANTVTFNSLVTGGASNNIPVFSDGADWRVG